MIITVKVKTGAREDRVVYNQTEDIYLVSTKARPVEGEANKQIIRLLAKHLDVPRSQISLKTGSKATHKLFEIQS